MKRLHFTLASIFLVVFALHTQNKSPHVDCLQVAAPESQGFSSARLQRIDKMLQEFVERGSIAGASAIIARNGKIVYYKAVGYDDIAKKSPARKDAIFRIASQTKAVTSVAVMMLYEEGKFLLEDPVSKYIPEFKNPKVIDKFNDADTTYTTLKAKREITIRDLLTHTSGIGYPSIGSKSMNALYAKEKIISGIDADTSRLGPMMRKLGSLPLFHQPGERFTYGLSIDVLGYLVEVVSGMSLDEFFHKRIFKPLGMNDTYFFLPKKKQARLWTLSSEDSLKHLLNAKDKRSVVSDHNPDYPNSEGTYFSGGSGLCSTAYDYAIFLQMMLNGGEYNGVKILGGNTVRMMTMNQIGDLSLYNGNAKFGLGFAVVTDLGSSRLPTPVGTYFWSGIFGSSYWVDPKEHLVAQLVLQQYPSRRGDIAEKFKVLVYQALR
ncbi:MAG: serine hydrolase [Ignavibacteriales bacterium]|nr:serine hydrolase [Ignavibacteriales bacterium]